MLGKGRSLTVWNRTAAKADGLVAEGAHRAATVADAVTASPVTIVCLNDYPTMYRVFEPAGALSGGTLVSLNSGTPAEARAAAGWAAERVPPPLIGHPNRFCCTAEPATSSTGTGRPWRTWAILVTSAPTRTWRCCSTPRCSA
ncbi:NAD(P)-binding domain-containing protein [Actinomadura sp. 21ATH]|uniref:NAD(P)-binding domain-containing protein n=1 Tax=Actinomadura sp. 21ATH TaxID=1735444 RepID=UPI0035C26027